VRFINARVRSKRTPRYIRAFAGCSLAEAVKMATWVPAGVAGIASRTGSIEPGKDADLALLHPDFAVAATIIGGEVVYQRDEG
jgi:N-acetylglucosamine-6-phosphate deacetylase